MTGESKRDTEPWVDKKGVKYAYAYDKGGKLKSRLGVGGIPHAFLIDALGRIIWEGHPQTIESSTVRRALMGTLKRPVFEWPEGAKSVRKAFLSGKVAKAIEAAGAMSEGGQDLAAELEEFVSATTKGVSRLFEEGDYLAVEDAGQIWVERFKGLPQAEEITGVLQKMSEDEEAQSVLDAQKSIAKLMGGKIKKGAIKKMVKQFDEIIAELPGTAAERDAKRAKAALSKK